MTDDEKAPGDINTHGMIVDFGKHRGAPWTRLPVSYLTWMVGSRHSKAEIAAAELKRRGTRTPSLDVSGHAIDRASLGCRKIWHETRGEDEGIHAWLVRVSEEALAAKDIDDKGRYRHAGMLFCFELDGLWPVLKTVMRKKDTDQ